MGADKGTSDGRMLGVVVSLGSLTGSQMVEMKVFETVAMSDDKMARKKAVARVALSEGSAVSKLVVKLVNGRAEAMVEK